METESIELVYQNIEPVKAWIPLVLGIVSVVGTGGWIWWEASSEEPEPARMDQGLIVFTLLSIILLISVFRLGKKWFN